MTVDVAVLEATRSIRPSARGMGGWLPIAKETLARKVLTKETEQVN